MLSLAELNKKSSFNTRFSCWHELHGLTAAGQSKSCQDTTTSILLRHFYIRPDAPLNARHYTAPVSLHLCGTGTDKTRDAGDMSDCKDKTGFYLD